MLVLPKICVPFAANLLSNFFLAKSKAPTFSRKAETNVVAMNESNNHTHFHVGTRTDRQNNCKASTNQNKPKHNKDTGNFKTDEKTATACKHADKRANTDTRSSPDRMMLAGLAPGVAAR